MKWSLDQSGFSFESEEPNPARNVGATIGRERNGVFFAEPGGAIEESGPQRAS
jgi:hypothetical protein